MADVYGSLIAAETSISPRFTISEPGKRTSGISRQAATRYKGSGWQGIEGADERIRGMTQMNPLVRHALLVVAGILAVAIVLGTCKLIVSPIPYPGLDGQSCSEIEPGEAAPLRVPGCQETVQQRNKEDLLVEPRDQISLIITEGSETDFQDDSLIFLCGSDPGGEIVVYVNDSPRFLHVFGGRLLPIDTLLEPGRNEVRFKGKHTTRLYAKVMYTTVYSPEESGTGATFFGIKRVLGKSWLPPEKECVTISFELPRDLQEPVYEVLPDDPQSRKRQREEIMGFLREMKQAWNQNDGELVWRLFNLECVLTPWGPPGSPEELREKKRSILGLVNGGQYEWVTPIEHIKMIFGKRAVLVYGGVGKDRFGAYLFRGRDRRTNELKLKHDLLVLARVKGKWTVIQ